jgi:isopentenyl-diphosphate delta-isomerase
MEKNVLLVNEQDEVIGESGKMEAHKMGLLHRAFSVFIFNSRGEMLLQQRAMNKYHSGGLWTNACCSHPGPGEETALSATRRLKEEMGFETPVTKVFDFIYRAEFENGLSENEFDHVYAGHYDGEIHPDPGEVMSSQYLSMDEIAEWMAKHPEEFTAWFRIAFSKINGWWKRTYKKEVA